MRRLLAVHRVAVSGGVHCCEASLPWLAALLGSTELSVGVYQYSEINTFLL